jgi:hypothetical protein
MNLVNYLNKGNIFKYYHHFTLSLTNKLQIRARKVNKLNNHLLQKYFYDFLNIMKKLKREGKKLLEKK